MALASDLLSPNPRLQQASDGPPAIRPQPAQEDRDAVERLQRALQQQGYLDPGFGLSGEVFGVFGPFTVKAVKAFQKTSYPTDPGQWDGVVGKGTLRKLDAALTGDTGDFTEEILGQSATDYGYKVPEITSVGERDQRTKNLIAFRVFKTTTPIRMFRFMIRRSGLIYWIDAACREGLRNFSEAHLFFHPSPGFAGLKDGEYDELAGGWQNVCRYTPWLGSQVAATGRDVVLLFPYMNSAYFSNLGFFANQPIARIEEMLQLVQGHMNPYDPNLPRLTALGTSSFSFGITPMAQFIGKVQGSGLLTEVFDFDGLFSNSASRMLATVPGARFRKYGQSNPYGMTPPGFFLAPQARWREFGPPQTGGEVHMLMPNLLLHAMSPGA